MIAGICQVLLAVWRVVGGLSITQIEAVLQSVLLRLADGEGGSGGTGGLLGALGCLCCTMPHRCPP